MKLAKDTRGEALAAMKRASRIAENNGTADMSLDEINAEIAAARVNNRHT
jgi:DNA-damage-inducible protein J